ncbi:MAG TPA: YkgJ family cysteine cluster protein [Planctomycetota bacterium]|nr:YkgJ family cysteine cluster protein [Planctomycetota bacterium]
MRTRADSLVLPPGARFTCHQCGDCCRSFPVSLSESEREKYASRDWSSVLPGHTGPVFDEVARGGGKTATLLKRRRDGACIFLGTENNLCQIHAKLGEAEKPLACKLFPFTVVAGDEEDPRPRIGCHFACKGLAAGDGAPVQGERRALEGLAEELGKVISLAPATEAVRWDAARSYGRSEVAVAATLLAAELQDAGRAFPERILAATKFLDLFAKSAFSQVKDEKRREFVEILAQGVREQVKKGLLRASTKRPTFPERMLLRQILGMAVRREPADLVTAGILRRTSRRLSSFFSGAAFAAGGGSFVPSGRSKRVRVSDVRKLAPEADPAAPIADAALTRYFVAHLSARRVTDSAFKVREALAGYGLLFRQYPAILLFARAACLAREGAELDASDYASALRTADWTFGHVPWTLGVIGGVRRGLLEDLDGPFLHLAWCAKRPG